MGAGGKEKIKNLLDHLGIFLPASPNTAIPQQINIV